MGNLPGLPAINKRITGQYVLYVFRIPFKKTEDWRAAAKVLIKTANEECSKFIEEAKKQFERNSNKYAIDAPNVEPRLHYSFSSVD